MKGRERKERGGDEGEMNRKDEEKRKKSSSLEVELVLQSLLLLCSSLERVQEGGGRALAKKTWSLILIKKDKEHQRPAPNLYQSGAPTIPMILKLQGAIQCQVLRQAQGLG